MAVNNIREVSAGDANAPDDVNQFARALKGDVVPRNASGVPTDRAGSLGTSALQWNDIRARRLFLNGVQVDATGGGGGTSQVTASLRNGVASGKSPNNRPGMNGWLLQAGAQGVKLRASADDPLELLLDGVSYTLTSEITGGTPLPSNYTLTGLQLQSATTLASGKTFQYGRSELRLTGGGWFEMASTDNSNLIPAANGDVFALKFSVAGGSEYIIASRYPGNRSAAFMAMRGMLNTSATDFSARIAGAIAHNASFSAVRVGFVFIDPTTDTWSIHTEARIVGAVQVKLPGTSGYATGDMVFRELNSRWYRFDGTAWQQTNRVYVGLCVIENGAVVGTVGVRDITSLNKLALLAADYDPPLVSDADGNDILLYGVNVENETDIERKSGGNLAAQAHDVFNPTFRIATGSLGLQNNSRYGIYLDDDGETVHVEKDTAPVVITHNGRAIYTHPQRNAVFVSSVGVDGSGGLVSLAGINQSYGRSPLFAVAAGQVYYRNVAGIAFPATLRVGNSSSNVAVDFDTHGGRGPFASIGSGIIVYGLIAADDAGNFWQFTNTSGSRAKFFYGTAQLYLDYLHSAFYD